MSSICAVHCALMPFALVALPVAGATVSRFHWLEIALMGMAVVIASNGIFRNRQRRIDVTFPVLLVTGGSTLLIIAHFAFQGMAEHLAAPLGAIAIATAQFILFRQAKTCGKCMPG